MSRPVFGVAFFLHLCVSVFFIVLGLEGFLYVWGIVGRSDVAMIASKLTGIFGGDSVVYIILISILEAACGAAMIFSLFSTVNSGFLRISVLVSMVLWLTVIILKDIFGASVFSGFSIGVLTQWLRGLILDIVLLLAILSVRVKG